MYKIISVALLCFTTTTAFAGWKEDLKKAAQQQAQEKVEKQLGLAKAAPSTAKAYIINIKDGDTVSSTFTVQFGLKGMGVAPAGTNVEGTGHFHLLIDNPTINLAAALPATEQIKHFGGGQIEADLSLKPGKHTLQLLMADWKHQPHNPAVKSEIINITVK